MIRREPGHAEVLVETIEDIHFYFVIWQRLDGSNNSVPIMKQQKSAWRDICLHVGAVEQALAMVRLQLIPVRHGDDRHCGWCAAESFCSRQK